MGIKHAKQSGLPADAGATSVVQPSDWYDDHVGGVVLLDLGVVDAADILGGPVEIYTPVGAELILAVSIGAEGRVYPNAGDICIRWSDSPDDFSGVLAYLGEGAPSTGDYISQAASGLTIPGEGDSTYGIPLRNVGLTAFLINGATSGSARFYAQVSIPIVP